MYLCKELNDTKILYRKKKKKIGKLHSLNIKEDLARNHQIISGMVRVLYGWLSTHKNFTSGSPMPPPQPPKFIFLSLQNTLTLKHSISNVYIRWKKNWLLNWLLHFSKSWVTNYLQKILPQKRSKQKSVLWRCRSIVHWRCRLPCSNRSSNKLLPYHCLYVLLLCYHIRGSISE